MREKHCCPPQGGDALFVILQSTVRGGQVLEGGEEVLALWVFTKEPVEKADGLTVHALSLGEDTPEKEHVLSVFPPLKEFFQSLEVPFSQEETGLEKPERVV